MHMRGMRKGYLELLRQVNDELMLQLLLTSLCPPLAVIPLGGRRRWSLQARKQSCFVLALFPLSQGRKLLLQGTEGGGKLLANVHRSGLSALFRETRSGIEEAPQSLQ